MYTSSHIYRLESKFMIFERAVNQDIAQLTFKIIMDLVIWSEKVFEIKIEKSKISLLL